MIGHDPEADSLRQTDSPSSPGIMTSSTIKSKLPTCHGIPDFAVIVHDEDMGAF